MFVFSLNKIASLFLLFLAVNATSTWAATNTVTVTVPRTAYMQWLESPGERMTQVSDTQTVVEFQGGGFGGGQQDLYLGILCNSLAGYQVTFIAAESLGGSRARAVGGDGESIIYEVTVSSVSGSLRGASVSLSAVDLSGSGVTIATTYASAQALPLRAERPNVFHIRAVAEEEIPLSRSFHGSITAVITLP